MRRERGHDGIRRCPRGCRTAQAEQRRQLTEVAADAGPLHHFLCTVVALTDQLDFAVVDDIRDVTRVALCEQDLALRQRDLHGFEMDRLPARRQLDDAIGQRKQSVVMRRDDHDPAGACRVA